MAEETSLFALMTSHLSKTRLDDGNANDPTPSTSEMLLPTPTGPRIAIPNFFPGNSPMKDFLAEQISKTLKAKEKKRQEEKEQRELEEEMKNLKIKTKQQSNELVSMEKKKSHDQQEYLIDLTSAIIQKPKPNQVNVQPVKCGKTLSMGKKIQLEQIQSGSGLPLRWDKETCRYKPWDPNLPCITTSSNVLKQRVKRGKCSNFGKVLCSRVWPIHHVVIPYEVKKSEFESNIVRFDFKTKSPCDIHRENARIYQENQRKPKMSQRWTVDILDFI